MPEALHARTSPTAIAGQVLLYGAFAAVIGVFSQWPIYHPIEPGQALIKVSFIHAGKPVGECVPLTEAERAKLPPNMRAPMKCPRERSPVTVEVEIDGKTMLRRSAPPSGLSRDGASAVYQRLPVPAGERLIAVRLADGGKGPAYQRQARFTLVPAQVLVIDFDAEKGGITFQ